MSLLLLLTDRTPESRTSALNDATHPPSASGGGTGLALAVIDAKIVLEQPQLTVGAAVIAQRRAAGFDRLVEHVLDRLHETLGALGRRARSRRQGRCGALGRQARAVQSLAHIDIAETGDDALVAQGGLQPGLLASAA